MRSSLVAVGLLVLALGGAAALVVSLSAPSADDPESVEDLHPLHETEENVEEEGSRPALVGRRREDLTSMTQVEGWVAALKGLSNKDAYAALWEIVRSNPRDPRLRKPVEKIIETRTGARRFTAMVALMQLEGSRRFMVAIAEQSLKAPSAWGRHMWLTAFDPELGNAFFRAFHAARNEQLDAAPRAELREVADLLVSDRERGRELLLRRLQAAEGDDQLPWLEVAGGIRPLPAEYGAIVRAHIAAGFDPKAGRTRMLWDASLDYTEIGPDLTAALLVRLPQAVEAERYCIFHTLGYLGCGDEAVQNALVVGFADPDVSRRNLLEACERLGAAVAPATADVIDACRDLHEGLRLDLARTLLAMRSPDALPYLAERLRGGSPEEQVRIARGLPDFPEAATLAPVLAEVARRQGSPHALRALVLLDLELAGREAHPGLRDALGSTFTALRKEALQLSRLVKRLPHDIIDGLLGCAGESSEVVRPEVSPAIADLGRLSTQGRPWIDELIGLTSRSDVSLVCAALRALGEIDGNDPRVRRLLFATLDDHDNRKRPELVSEAGYQILRAALWGLGGTDNPTPEEYRRIASMCGRYTAARRYLIGDRLRVQGNPTWERVRATVGIRLAHRPRIRPPTWGRRAE